MYLVAIAWFYVVLMMALAEALAPQGSLLGAGITLLLYGLLPLAVVLYILGAPHRRRARLAAEAAELAALAGAVQVAEGLEGREGVEAGDPAPRGTGAATVPGPARSDGVTAVAAVAPDGGGEATGDAVAPVRKEA